MLLICTLFYVISLLIGFLFYCPGEWGKHKDAAQRKQEVLNVNSNSMVATCSDVFFGSHCSFRTQWLFIPIHCCQPGKVNKTARAPIFLAHEKEFGSLITLVRAGETQHIERTVHSGSQTFKNILNQAPPKTQHLSIIYYLVSTSSQSAAAARGVRHSKGFNCGCCPHHLRFVFYT